MRTRLIVAPSRWSVAISSQPVMSNVPVACVVIVVISLMEVGEAWTPESLPVIPVTLCQVGGVTFHEPAGRAVSS
ncbi:hypothetical protein Misp02_40660 [Microtetraspora sp. NBRC 16547]|nr:hypothetical protein Misp02_40660 [Microtetraspora sp. NBRC 16547]